jgi:hypothetical protein
MFLATSNGARQLLLLSYIQQVRLQELKHGQEDIQALLAALAPGFRLLVDFSQLESIDLDCTVQIGRAMEVIDQSGVTMVVRVIPDPRKDIGMNILAIFHYPHRPQIVTCQTMTEAAKVLGL